MTLHLQKMLFPMLFCVLLGALHVTAQAGCGPPPRVNNGRPDSTNTFFPVNDMVRYQCNSGYAATKNSSLRLQCVANGTWGELNYWCERKTCSPKPIDQGSYTGGISFGDTITYTCDDGYALTGKTYQLTCMADGTWNPVDPPDCQPVSCPEIDLTEKLVFQLSLQYQYGSRVTYSCEAGFSLIGDSFRDCLESGKWSGSKPICKDVKCKTPQWDISHGQAMGERKEAYKYNDIVRYECSARYRAEPSEIHCTESNEWSATVNCVLTGCHSPPLIGNGDVVQPKSEYAMGDSASYKCRKGYRLEGSETAVCRENYQWTQPPTCASVTCGPPATVINGKIKEQAKTPYAYGDRVSYICDDTYHLVGNGEITCQNNGQWSPSPSCALRTTSLPRTEDPLQCSCDKPPAIEHGEGNDKYKSVYACGYTLSYKCKTCYFPVHSEITCQQNGQWSHSPGCVFNATCVIVPVVIIVALIGAMLAFAFFKKIACFAPSGSKTINDPRKNENEIPLNDTMSLKPNDA
uniref:Sushi, von Willebrand factor type A, EGF and pentraxin domain-containing protein 1-like isoform X1 n=2 Tax=Petromyzon marinus TaxID=7757 RepID=A0AAJ7T411_PETMA|nr:sushi, von Willebrand factor type A, EGF and pentraxin domain-containing protein 1-like isoform X1 [Petromyzon marinus]